MTTSYDPQALARRVAASWTTLRQASPGDALDLLESLSFTSGTQSSPTMLIAAYITQKIEDEGDPNPKIVISFTSPPYAQAIEALYASEGIAGLRRIFAPMKGRKIKSGFYGPYNAIFNDMPMRSETFFLDQAVRMYGTYVLKEHVSSFGMAISYQLMKFIVQGMCNELGIPLESLSIKVKRIKGGTGDLDEVYLNGQKIWSESIFVLYDTRQEATDPGVMVYKRQGEPLPDKLQHNEIPFRTIKGFAADFTKYRVYSYRDDAKELLATWRKAALPQWVSYNYGYRNELANLTPFKSYIKQFLSRLEKADPALYAQMFAPYANPDITQEMRNWYVDTYLTHNKSLCQKTWAKMKMREVAGPYEHDKALEKECAKALSRQLHPHSFTTVAYYTLCFMVQGCLKPEHKLTRRDVIRGK
jgi:hypothetical protein